MGGIMMNISMTDHEAMMLLGILKNDLSELHSEISHTDSREYRDTLRQKEFFIKDVMKQLMSASISENERDFENQIHL